MPSALIGQQFLGPHDETFTITDFLGRGAFGEVYRAKGSTTGMVIAVKLLPVGRLSGESERIALLNEIQTARQVDHPNVVKVLHVDEGKNTEFGPFACLEYVSGGNLAQLLRVQSQGDSPIPIKRATEMMIDIAQGARAINVKLIHRDIKPDNILIEGTTLKIGDFGISKFVDESTRLRTFKGGQHVAYMAPEGWVNDRNTHKLDIYAVGIVFFEILTLQHPLVNKVQDPGNILDWEKAHLYERVPDVRTIRQDAPLSLSQLIARMTAKRPQDRPEWDETLKILSAAAIEKVANETPGVTKAVELAIAKRQEAEKRQLEELRNSREYARQFGLYEQSCKMLLDRFNPSVQQFNEQFQSGGIQAGPHLVGQQLQGTTFSLPTGNSIVVRFFEPADTGVKIQGGTIMGGGWIGLTEGRSANLVLLKESTDDLYGKWIVCEIGLMALVDVRRLIGRFGLTEKTVTPFGFRNSHDYYDQIRYAQGGTHAFTYSFIDDVEGYFVHLMTEGCS